MLKSVGQYARHGIEVEAGEEDDRSQCHRVLHDGEEPSEVFCNFLHGQRQRDNAVAQEGRIAAKAVGVVEHRPARFDLGRVAFHRVLIQSNQKVEAVAVRVNFLFANAHPQPNMAASDHRLIAVISADVKPPARNALGQGVAGLVQTVAGGAPDPYSKLARHNSLPVNLLRISKPCVAGGKPLD